MNTQRKKKGLLMIAYWFPPMKTVSLRSYFVYSVLKKQLRTVKVLTTDNSSRLAQEEMPLDKADLYGLKTYDYRRFLQSKQQRNNSFTVEEKAKPWKQVIVKLLNSFPFNLIVGEGGLRYIWDGYHTGKQLLLTGDFDYIFSSYRPYADHAIGYLLKRKFPKLIWIADCRDVHVEPNVSTVYGVSFQHYCNKKILQHADVVTTVSEGLAVQVRRYNPKIYVLRNGFVQLPNQLLDLQPTNKFQIIYTGSLFFQKRNPLLLLKAIQLLIQDNKITASEMVIKYAGQDGGLWKKWLLQTNTTSLFEDLGMISRKAALRLQYNAQVNLLLTYNSNKGGGNLTGKFYEYLFAKSPVLVVINGNFDPEFENISQNLNGVEVAYSDRNEIEKAADFIYMYYCRWKATSIAEKVINEADLEPFQWSNMMETFLTKLENGEI